MISNVVIAFHSRLSSCTVMRFELCFSCRIMREIWRSHGKYEERTAGEKVHAIFCLVTGIRRSGLR